MEVFINAYLATYYVSPSLVKLASLAKWYTFCYGEKTLCFLCYEMVFSPPPDVRLILTTRVVISNIIIMRARIESKTDDIGIIGTRAAAAAIDL